MKTRKVAVTLTLEVDVEAWCDTYGLFPALVPGDVKEYITTSVQGLSAASSGLIASVSLKNR